MNIVFIGMPGCGKTVVSQRVAELLKLPWFDSDWEIEKAEGMGIPEIFAQKGEDYFRWAETACITMLMSFKDAVIAVGGGAVERNHEIIGHNSEVIYLRRSINSIWASLEPGARPLIRDADSLHALYRRRRGIYEAMSDFTVENDGGIDDAARKVIAFIAAKRQ